MVDPEALQAALKALSDDYAAKLPGRLAQIEQAWERLPRDSWQEEGFQELLRMVHSLTGSGKTFGFALLSDAARSLEMYLRELGQAKVQPNDEQRERARVLLGELRKAADIRE